MAVEAQRSARVAAERVVVEPSAVDVVRRRTGRGRRRGRDRRTRSWRSIAASPTRAVLRDVGERAVARVAVERVGAEVRDVEVHAAVAVVVARARAHAVAAVPDARRRGGILERAVAAVAEQPMPARCAHRRVGQRAAVDEEDVQSSRRCRSRRTARREPMVSTRCLSGLAPLTWWKVTPALRATSTNRRRRLRRGCRSGLTLAGDEERPGQRKARCHRDEEGPAHGCCISRSRSRRIRA